MHMVTNRKNIGARIAKYAVLVFFALLILFPIYMVISGSFKSLFELYDNIFGLPESFKLDNYVKAFVDGHLKEYYLNSFIVTGSSLLLLTFLGSMGGFALTRLGLKMSKPIYYLFVIGISIPTQVGIVQLALQMSKMRLMNSLFGLIMVHTAYELPFTIFIFYGFMEEIQWDLQEAAVIDGCSQFQLYWNIMLPLCRSAVATCLIFNMVTIWNDMLFPLILISKEKLRTLPYGLLMFSGQHGSQYTIIFAGVIIITLPLTILYLFLQKQFMEGLTSGAVKG